MPGGRLSRRARQAALADGEAVLRQQVAQVVVQRGDAVVVESRRARAEHRHVLPCGAERLAVADELAADVAQGVVGTAPLELVDRDGVGEVEHVDLLELGRGTELRGHHVQRAVREGDDVGVALPDPGSLDDHQVERGGLQHGERVGQVLGQPPARPARRHRPEEHLPPVEGVHPDPVAEQRSPAAPAGRVDGEHGDPQLVLLVAPEPAHQLVGQRRLARPPGAGDAQHRHAAARSEVDAGQAPVLGEGQQAGHHGRITGVEAVDGRGRDRQVDVAPADHQVDHPGQPELLAVLRREDPCDPALVQQRDLPRDDHPAATAVDLDVPGAALAQQLDQVGEVLDVPALVRADGHALHVLLDRGGDHFVHRAVVPEVDHLGTVALQDPPHDVDRRVVPVEQARGRHEADGVLRCVHPRRSSRSIVGHPTILARGAAAARVRPRPGSARTRSAAVPRRGRTEPRTPRARRPR